MHVHTRVKEKVDAVEGAELFCTICETWKSPQYFIVNKKPKPGQRARYESQCKSCQYLKNSLRVLVGGKLKAPPLSAVREALGNHTFVGALNQARHGGQRAFKPLSTAAREELRERREEAEGRPDMCYLVGMEGDRTAVKIGHSTNVYRRMAHYQAGNPRKLVVLALLDGGQARERELHQKFMHLHDERFVGEWFRLDPAILNEFRVRRMP